jgi:hypothetical protein
MLLSRNIFKRAKIYLALTQDLKSHYSHVTRGLLAKDEKFGDDIHSLFKKTEVKPVNKLGPDESIGEELTGPLDKGTQFCNQFFSLKILYLVTFSYRKKRCNTKGTH